jgi:hypothetical protein
MRAHGFDAEQVVELVRARSNAQGCGSPTPGASQPRIERRQEGRQGAINQQRPVVYPFAANR